MQLIPPYMDSWMANNKKGIVVGPELKKETSTNNLLAKSSNLTNLGFPEIRGFPLVRSCEVAIMSNFL